MYPVNPILALDFYKVDHRRQYPEGTEFVYSNLTPRSDRLAPVLREQWDGKLVWFGFQAFAIRFLTEVFNESFFKIPKEEAVKGWNRRLATSLGPNGIGDDHIRALHDLGYLPIVVKALPEGSLVPMKVPTLTVRNTKKEFFWLTNALETIFSAYLWKASNSATLAKEYRRLLVKYAGITGSDVAFVDWQGHDFSFRGMSGLDDSVMSGAGHLLSFTGTDTIPAIDFLETYYGADAEKELIGGSVAATEHSVMCMGMEDGEEETFRRLIEDIYPSGIISIVSDTWDFWNVVSVIALKLKDKILAREGKVVFRPDSGDPVEILCGIEIEALDADEFEDAKYEALDVLRDRVGSVTPHGECGDSETEGLFRFEDKVYLVKAEIEWNRYDKQYYFMDGASITSFEEVNLTPEQKGAVETLWDIFGGTITSTGHNLLDSHVGLIYGDSITLDRANQILSRLAKKGFASANVVFGVGSFTYEYATRDTFGFAMKATAGVVNGEFREIFKNPKTDSGVKKSAKGLLRVERENGTYVLYDQQTEEQEADGELQVVFKDGVMYNQQTLSEIRERLKWELGE